MSIAPWLRDLDMLLANPDSTLLPTTHFKLFADLVYAHRESLPATLNVQYMVKRLSGISKHSDAFWPPQRAPGWMIATDADSEHHEERMKVRKAAPIKFPRLISVAKVPNMEEMKNMGVQPAIVVMTALALFNIQQTGQDYAIFNNLKAARSWPFMPSWVPLPPPMSIDGKLVLS